MGLRRAVDAERARDHVARSARSARISVARVVPRARSLTKRAGGGRASGLSGLMATDGRACAENKLLCKAAHGPSRPLIVRPYWCGAPRQRPAPEGLPERSRTWNVGSPVRAADSLPRLRRLCEEEGPEPLRRRGLLVPLDFLTAA